jgi:hypothetical protein
MSLPTVIGIVVVIAVIMLVIVVLFALRARRVDLTHTSTSDQPPVWLKTTPPAETLAAARVAGRSPGLYAQIPREQVAAPFIEQIEDMLQAQLRTDPALADYKIDLGTASDGGLEIWVNGKSYADINLIPDERPRQAIRATIEKWQAS